MEVIIEKATLQEAPVILGLLVELYSELGEEAGSVQYVNEKTIIEILNSGNTEIYLAKTTEQEIVGILTLTECQAIYAGGKYGSLDEMFIKPSFRSERIGTTFIEKIKVLGKEKNWRRIDVTTPTEERWKKTVEFYEKCGFAFTGSKLKLDIK